MYTLDVESEPSVLGKELNLPDQIEYQETKLNGLRITEILKNTAEKNPKIGRLADLYKKYQKSEKIDAEISKEIIQKLSNKFKEYIIDEDEAEVIQNLVKIAVQSDKIHLYDRLDIVYKYARLYFKCLDKQYYQESKTNLEEDVKEDIKGDVKEGAKEDVTENTKEEKESLDPNSERYLQVTNWLFDCIERILNQFNCDVTQLQGYLKKLFLLMTSMYIVSLKFPQKYDFLSLDPDKLLSTREDKVEKLENRLIDCILTVEYKGNIL